MSITKIDFSQLYPAKYEAGPSKEGYSAGRLFKFDQDFEKAKISFQTDIHDLSYALAVLTSTKVNEEGIHHPCSCNGPHHALIVANFSYMVAGEMLAHEKMRSKIDQIMLKFSLETQEFLTADNHQNYKKLIELMALFHDTGRPGDSIDGWDATNELNVIHNVGYLLRTTDLSGSAIDEIMCEIEIGIKNKDKTRLKNDTGFLFGAALGAGDSLHSGHAFHGGEWDSHKYDPKYVRLYVQYPDFQDHFKKIVSEVRKFVPEPRPQNGGRLAAVKKYLHQWENEKFGDGWSVIKPDFTTIISNEFSVLDPGEYAIMAKHFNANQSLQAGDQSELNSNIPFKEDSDQKQKNPSAIINDPSFLDRVISFFKKPSLARNILIGALVASLLVGIFALTFLTPAGAVLFPLMVSAFGSALGTGLSLAAIGVFVIGLGAALGGGIGKLFEKDPESNVESVLPVDLNQDSSSTSIMFNKGFQPPIDASTSTSEPSEVPHVVVKGTGSQDNVVTDSLSLK